MKQDKNITIQSKYGCNTRTTVGRPKKRSTSSKPVTFAPTFDNRGPQGPGAEARARMEEHKALAQQTIDRELKKGATLADALRMARNYLKAGSRANIQYQAELGTDAGFAPRTI